MAEEGSFLNMRRAAEADPRIHKKNPPPTILPLPTPETKGADHSVVTADKGSEGEGCVYQVSSIYPPLPPRGREGKVREEAFYFFFLSRVERASERVISASSTWS